MGLFSSLGGAIGGIFEQGDVNNGYDRIASGLNSGFNALNQGLNQTQARIQPTAQIATNSIGNLNDILNNGDMSKFYNNPAYQYTLQQSTRGLNAQAAQQGTLMSGNTLKALQTNASGLASQNYNSYINNLSGLFNQTSPYLQQYNQIPYTQGQNADNFYTALGANEANGQFAKGSIATGIGSGIGSALDSGFGTGSSFNPSNISYGQISQQPWQTQAGIPQFGQSLGIYGGLQ